MSDATLDATPTRSSRNRATSASPRSQLPSPADPPLTPLGMHDRNSVVKLDQDESGELRPPGNESSADAAYARSKRTTEPDVARRTTPQRLTILIHSASDLAAVDSSGYDDAYVHLTVKSGKQTWVQKTKSVRSLSPAWGAEFHFDGVVAEFTEVVMVVQNRNVLFRDAHLGQVDFSLRELDIPRDGTLTPQKTYPLAPSASRRRQVSKLRGRLTFQLAWCRSDDGDVPADALEDDELKGFDDDVSAGQAPPPKWRPTAAAEAQREPLVAGDYQLRVHVIEARDLAPRDAGGTSDPLVLVHCFGERKHTSVKSKQNNVIWDEVRLPRELASRE